MRLIDADAFVIDSIKNKRFVFSTKDIANDFVVVKTVYKDLLDAINNTPTVDAEPVRHGAWEWLGPNSMVRGCMCGTCSVCKVRSKYIVNVGICPNCGAKMDGGKQDAE